MTNIEIAQQARLKPIIGLIREKFQVDDDHLEPYGRFKAKLSLPPGGFTSQLPSESGANIRLFLKYQTVLKFLFYLSQKF